MLLARVRYALRRLLRQIVSGPLTVIHLATARSNTIGSISVYVTVGDLEAESDLAGIVAKVSDACSLVAAADPRRGRQLQRYIRRILIQKSSTSGFLTRPDVVLLALSLIEGHGPETIAGVLVHEATHARLAGHGIRSWPDVLARVERRCILEQIDFLSRLPGRHDLVDYYSTWLDQVWWSHDQRIARRRKFLVDLGAPRWASRI